MTAPDPHSSPSPPFPSSSAKEQQRGHRRRRSASLPSSTTLITVENDIELHYSIFPIMPSARQNKAGGKPLPVSSKPKAESNSSPPSSPSSSLKKSKSFSQRLIRSLAGPSSMPPPHPPVPPLPHSSSSTSKTKSHTSEKYRLELKLEESDRFELPSDPAGTSSSSTDDPSPFGPKPPRPPIGKSKLSSFFTSLPAASSSTLLPTLPATPKPMPKRTKWERRPLYQQCILQVFGRTPHGHAIIKKGAVKGIQYYKEKQAQLEEAQREKEAIAALEVSWAKKRQAIAAANGREDNDGSDDGSQGRKRATGWKKVVQTGKIFWSHVQEGLADDVTTLNARPPTIRGHNWVAAV